MTGTRGVAEFNAEREMTGKVHRPLREPTAKRNRSQYRTRCGRVVRYGLPVAFASATDVCRHCYPNAGSVRQPCPKHDWGYGSCECPS